MASQVEGEWKDFTFKFIEKEDLPKLYDHLREDFMKDETTMRLVGYTDELVDDFQQIYDWMFGPLNEGLSFIAIHTKTGDVAGARLTYTHRRDTDLTKMFNFKSKPIKALFDVFEVLEKDAKVFDYYGIDHYAYFLSASTAAAYRKQGLATEMYRRTFALLRERNFPMCKSIFTSPYSRKCATNFNFELLATVHYQGFKNENGELVVPNAGPNDHAVIMCLKL